MQKPMSDRRYVFTWIWTIACLLVGPVLFFWVLLSCTPALAPVGGSGCDAACANMVRLTCELGEPPPEGHPCTEVCRRTESGGISFSTPCLARAESCEAADRCE